MHDKGAVVPPWFGDYSNKAKWYTDGVPASGPTNGFYNLISSTNSVHEYIQYGQNTDGWAGTRFIDETVTVTSQTTNADGTISVQGTVNVGPIGAYPTDHIKTPVRVQYTVTVNGVVIHRHEGNTGDAYLELGSPATQNFNVTVPAQGASDATSVKLDWVYPDHEFPDAHFVLGVELYNPTPPTYVPFALRDGNSWKGLNNHNGFIKVRNGANGSWVDKGDESTATSMQPNTGHNRVRNGANGTWLQAPAMGDS